MASTSVLAGLEYLKWQKTMMEESMRESGFKAYTGTEQSEIICVKNDLATDGYTIRIGLSGRLKGAGVSGSTTLSGTEEAMSQYYQDVTWDFHRHAVIYDKKEKEKSAVRLMEMAKPKLRAWAGEKIKYQMITAFHSIYVPGTAGGIPFGTASAAQRNTWMTNNSDRVLFGKDIANAASNVHATALATIDGTADKLSVAMGRKAKNLARLADPFITPYKNPKFGRDFFVMFCHPWCFRDLKDDPVMIQANRDARAREGSSMDDNPLFQDGDLLYDGIIYREIPEFYQGRTGGVNADTHLAGVGTAGIAVGVNFLCGQQAIAMANKQAPRPTEKTETDYDFVNGHGIEMAHGIEKLTWANNPADVLRKDHGMVTVYAAAIPDA